MPKNDRRHRGFDSQSRGIYPTLLNYWSHEIARENIPLLAEALGVTPQTIGAHIGQAMRHPGVYKLLTEMGYVDSQIPQWFKRPRRIVVSVVEQPKALPTTTSEPRATATSQPDNAPSYREVVPFNYRFERAEEIPPTATIHYLNEIEDPWRLWRRGSSQGRTRNHRQRPRN